MEVREFSGEELRATNPIKQTLDWKVGGAGEGKYGH